MRLQQRRYWRQVHRQRKRLRGRSVQTAMLDGVIEFAPDGSVTRVIAAQVGEAHLLAFTAELSDRWEYVAANRSVARNCAGIIVARYFSAELAEAIRKQQRVVTL